MWGTLLTKFGDSFVRWFLVPLFSKAVMWAVEYYQNKKAQAERNSKIDEALSEYKGATDAKAKEEAFKKLIHSGRS